MFFSLGIKEHRQLLLFADVPKPVNWTGTMSPGRFPAVQSPTVARSGPTTGSNYLDSGPSALKLGRQGGGADTRERIAFSA
jgi:hypothetical protein